jgi:hypothetical protein
MSSRCSRTGAGQVVVMFALALLVILLTVGLVVDGGTAFLQRRDGQNDADLSALAGTKVVADAYVSSPSLGLTRGSVYQAVSDSLTQNGCRPSDPTPCTWQALFVGAGETIIGPVTPGDGSPIEGGSGILGVRVDVIRRPKTYFLGLIGQSHWTVDSSATGLTTAPTAAPADQLLPIALAKPGVPFQAGQVYDLTAGKDAPGGFAWLAWGGEGTGSGDVCNPNNPGFGLGSSFVGRPTNPSPSVVNGCLDQWIRSGSTVLIPIYDKVTGTGLSARYRIAGVAAFVLVSRGVPTTSDIRAFFVGTYAYPGAPTSAAAQPPSKDDSLYYLGLIR